MGFYYNVLFRFFCCRNRSETQPTQPPRLTDESTTMEDEAQRRHTLTSVISEMDEGLGSILKSSGSREIQHSRLRTNEFSPTDAPTSISRIPGEAHRLLNNERSRQDAFEDEMKRALKELEVGVVYGSTRVNKSDSRVEKENYDTLLSDYKDSLKLSEKEKTKLNEMDEEIKSMRGEAKRIPDPFEEVNMSDSTLKEQYDESKFEIESRQKRIDEETALVESIFNLDDLQRPAVEKQKSIDKMEYPEFSDFKAKLSVVNDQTTEFMDKENQKIQELRDHELDAIAPERENKKSFAGSEAMENESTSNPMDDDDEKKFRIDLDEQKKIHDEQLQAARQKRAEMNVCEFNQPFSWTGFASYANYTPTYANHTDERSVLSSSTPNNESSSSDPGSHDIISPYSDVSVFEFDRTVFDSNQLFHLLRKSFADNNLTESNKTQDTSPIEDVSLCQDTEGISNRSDSLTEVLDDTLRNQGDESFSDNNEKSCNEQVSGESVTDSSSSFESGSSTATQLNSDVSTSRNETTVDESNKKSNSQLLSISNQLNQLLSLLKKRAESHFEDLHDKDTEKNTSDVNINESTNTETQSSNCDTVQLNASNLPISVYEEHQNDEKSRSNGCKILSNINQNGFAHEDHSKMFAEPIVTESNNTQNTLLIDKYSLCQDTEDTLKRSDSFEKLKMPDGILKNQADKSQSENGEFQNENAEMTFVDQQMLNLNPPDQQTTQFDQTIEALLESYKNELTLLAPSDTVVQNQERLTREIREFEEINGEIEQLSAEPNSETISSTKLIVPEETPEEQVSDSGDDNLNDPEFEEKLREQEERHRQEWEALMKKRKSKR
uniref:PH domain-containing protein n=1 Tax=Caenorhabditis tropicalis TaxID=1561998 RepID=A0A1I7TQK8_9PELO